MVERKEFAYILSSIKLLNDGQLREIKEALETEEAKRKNQN